MSRSIALVMMVRNEAATLATTIRSAVETIGAELGAVVIVDTGSTDGTRDVLDRCKRRGWFPATIPADTIGVSVAEPFRYDDGRNAALTAAENWLACLGQSWEAESIRWLFMLDAGTIVRGRPTLPPEWPDEGDGPTLVNVTCRMTTLEWQRPQLIRRGSGWRYVGARHECLVGGEGTTGDSGLIVSYELKDPARPDRWESDLEALRPDAEKGDARAAFYYAQTFDCLGRTAEACAWYGKRLSLRGFWQERYISALRIGIYGADLGMLAMAIQIDGARAESFVSRCAARRELARQREVPPDRADWIANIDDATKAIGMLPRPDALFIDRASYGWRAYDELALALYYVGEPEQAQANWMKALQGGTLGVRPGEKDQARIVENIRHAQTAVRGAGDDKPGGILNATPEDT